MNGVPHTVKFPKRKPKNKKQKTQLAAVVDVIISAIPNRPLESLLDYCWRKTFFSLLTRSTSKFSVLILHISSSSWNEFSATAGQSLTLERRLIPARSGMQTQCNVSALLKTIFEALIANAVIVAHNQTNRLRM